MRAEFKSHTHILRDEWDALVRRSPQGNLYALSHYLDLVAPDWSGIEVFDGQKLVAVMPLHVRTRRGFKVSLQAPFVQYWGLFLDQRPSAKVYKQFSWERKVVQAAVEAIPKDLRWFAHGFSPHFRYPLPFHWQDYQLRSRYTYLLDISGEEKDLWAGLGKNTKYEINKAKGLEVREGPDAGSLLGLVEKNAVAGKQLLRGEEAALLKKIVSDSLAHSEGFVLEAWEGERLSAAGFFATFEHKTVYLMSAQDPSQKQNGAMTRLVWEALLRRRGAGQIFDFEGSMLEGVEGFFRGFGARPVSYLFIEKNDLPLWVKWIRKLR